VAQKLTNGEQLLARLPAGTRERIDAVLGSAETRADFLRAAVERELYRREKRYVSAEETGASPGATTTKRRKAS